MNQLAYVYTKYVDDLAELHKIGAGYTHWSHGSVIMPDAFKFECQGGYEQAFDSDWLLLIFFFCVSPFIPKESFR